MVTMDGDADVSMDNLIRRLSGLGVHRPIPKIPTTSPSVNPLDIYRSYLAQEIAQILDIDIVTVYAALDWTTSLDKGDLVLPCPRLRIKGTKPADLALTIAKQISEDPLFEKPEVDDFSLRFRFSPELVVPIVLSAVFDTREEYGLDRARGLKDPADPSKGRKKIVIEFSSPNIAKEFHAGHLRSTIIGGFLSNLYAGSGWDVTRMNYLGDWGRQYGLLAVGWERFGSEELFEQNPTGHLFDVYVRITAQFKPEEEAYKAASKRGDHAEASRLETTGLLGQAKDYFKRMEQGDEDALALWRRFRSTSIEKYKSTYSRLNIHFDDYSGESQVSTASMGRAETELRERGISEVDRDATIIDFTKHGLPKLATAIIRNRNDTTTYLLRDIGAAIERWEKYQFDSMIYVVMSEQDIHVKRLIAALDLSGHKDIASRILHINFGKVQGMSTRNGTVKFLDDILEECSTTMHEVMRRNEAKYAHVEDPEQVADTLGISACIVQDYAGKRINGYPFDLKRMTSFEGDTGPYLQYAHARLRSIFRKLPYDSKDLADADFSLLKEPHAVNLVRLIARYPDVITQTLKTLEPTTLLTYLFRLTHQLSSSYDVLRVIDAPEGPQVSKARAALYECARQVLNNGMRMLGLSPVERM